LGNKEKWEKNPFAQTPPPAPNLKGIKAMHHGPSHWLDEIPLLQTVRHNFSPGLIPLAKNTHFIPLIWVRRGGFWAKYMGLKSAAIGNTLGEQIENLGNNLGTW